MYMYICVHMARTWCVRRWEYTETYINHIRRYKPLYKLIQKQIKKLYKPYEIY